MSFYLILLYLDLFCKFINTPINVCKEYGDDCGEYLLGDQGMDYILRPGNRT